MPRFERSEVALNAFLREQRAIVPQGNAIGAPIASESPARQGFARIPFALPVMQKAARCEALSQAIQQALGERPLLGTQRRDIPLSSVHIVDGNEGGFAAHGEAHVSGADILIDPAA